MTSITTALSIQFLATFLGLVVAVSVLLKLRERKTFVKIVVILLCAVLLLIPRQRVPRLPLLIGVVVMFIGFIMPIPKMSGKEFTHAYFVLGIASWCLLFMYAMLLYTGLCWVKQGWKSWEMTNDKQAMINSK